MNPTKVLFFLTVMTISHFPYWEQNGLNTVSIIFVSLITVSLIGKRMAALIVFTIFATTHSRFKVLPIQNRKNNVTMPRKRFWKSTNVNFKLLYQEMKIYDSHVYAMRIPPFFACNL